jgi:predicted dehydrogenase
MRIGIVGAGTMGGRYALRIAAGEFGSDATIAGVADLDGQRAGQVALHAGGVPSFTSIDALIAAERPDALYIATPDGAHRVPAVAAAEAGIPFLVEKPLATTIADADAIAEAVARAGVVAEVNFSNRWNPPFVAAKQAIERGELGAFVTLSARLNNSIGSPTSRLRWAGETTSAWFLASHCLDLAYWLHGRHAVSVYATGAKRVLAERGIDSYDGIHALVRYEDGTDGAFEAVWILPDGTPSPVEFGMRYVGTHGATTIDTHEQHIRLHSATTTTFPGTLNWAPQRFAAFLAAVRGDRAPGVPMADGVENTRILVALHRSLASGAVEPV